MGQLVHCEYLRYQLQRANCSSREIWFACLRRDDCSPFCGERAVSLAGPICTRNGTVELELGHLRLTSSVFDRQAPNLHWRYFHVSSKTYPSFVPSPFPSLARQPLPSAYVDCTTAVTRRVGSGSRGRFLRGGREGAEIDPNRDSGWPIRLQNSPFVA